jgi:hypothetical protein
VSPVMEYLPVSPVAPPNRMTLVLFMAVIVCPKRGSGTSPDTSIRPACLIVSLLNLFIKMGCAESREKSEGGKEKKNEPETVPNRDAVRDSILKDLLSENNKTQDLPQYQVKNKGTSEDIINSLKDNWEIMHKVFYI